ncbi:MAG: zf-HC2 domain-containing protein [Proteobacteria bacterium]|jgi:hypothetical protein|nr:zf-HC2 domain-containing protein [Pseudomonadota bacterium]MDA1298720.1 zf-HC2 domain-containing protein [Pseudomonadota bacterium]
MSTPDCHQNQVLLSGLLDGELTAEESAAVTKHLSRCEDCQREYEALRQQMGQLNAISFTEPGDEALNAFWRLPFSGFARNAGLLLVIGSYLLLLGYGTINFFTDDSEWFLGKFAFAGIIIGGLILFSIVIIERAISYQTDPYKEIKR